SSVRQQDGRAHPVVVRILRTAHPAMARQRGHSHRRAGAQHSKFKDRICWRCGQCGPSIRMRTPSAVALAPPGACHIKPVVELFCLVGSPGGTSQRTPPRLPERSEGEVVGTRAKYEEKTPTGVTHGTQDRKSVV